MEPESLGLESVSPLLPQIITSQKLVKCRKFANSENLPLSYTENSFKEQQTLEHVKDYERQFHLIYGHIIPSKLMLYPPNECSVEKFLPTTVRPTQMPFIELYDWDSCSEFIANFLEYEELNPPNQLPQVIPSPANVLKWQYGDCFDFAIVLCSLLIGAGYDAYCVHGRAPREITTRDQTRMKCPLLQKEQDMPDNEQVPDVQDDEEFPLNFKPPLISRFLKQKDEDAIKREEYQRLLEKTIDDDAPEFLPPDPWYGQRLHCWILILEGKRGVEQSFFLEPTTGRRYEIEDSTYENVDYLWNDQNYWVHLWPNKPASEINFDLTIGEEWEYVMLDPMRLDGDKDDHDDENEEGVVDDNRIVVDEMGSDGYVKEIESIKDLPPPWCAKLRIDRDVFAQKCPQGEKTVFYEKSRVDNFADYSQYDGLVQRIAQFKDYKRHIVDEMRWVFSRRKDKLVVQRRYPHEFKTVKDYAPGNPCHWKQIVKVDGTSKLFIYYPTRNIDGLIRREEYNKQKFKEYFQDRVDYMVYRSWRQVIQDDQSKDNTSDRLQILKATQKFDKNPNLPYGQKIAKIVFDMVKRNTIVYYHYEPGSIIRQVKEYSKDKLPPQGKLQEGMNRDESTEIYYQELQRITDMEKKCTSDIKAHQANIKQEAKRQKDDLEQWEKLRRNNDVEGALNKEFIIKSIYDKAREKNKEQMKETEDDKDQENAALDYLTPVLRKLQLENRRLSAKDALDVKNVIMHQLKKRLVNRCDIINKSLEREKKNLQDKIQQHNRKADHVTPEEQAEFDAFVNEANFRIEILEQRAAKHQEQALDRYVEMDQKLQNDPILSALKQISGGN